MMKVISLLVLMLSLLVVMPADAQDGDDAFEQIDRAMDDLSELLGRSVSRRNAYWTWTETVYPDTSLDCPAPDTTYTEARTRGYSINITFDGGEYNYRATPDGTIFFQCVNGEPANSEVPTTVPALPTEPVSAPLQLPAEWRAWIYQPSLRLLTLLDISGEIQQMSIPPLPGEQVGDLDTPSLVISPDGQFVVISTTLENSSQAIGIYNLNEGVFNQVHEAQAGESIQLGYDNTDTLGGSNHIFDRTGQFVAIGYFSPDFDLPENSSWRVTVYELSTGNPVYQLDSTNPELEPFTAEVYIPFPRVLYYGDDVIHFQLIPAFAEGTSYFEAFAWHPNANFIEASPYRSSDIDIQPDTGLAVFPYMAENFGSIEAFGPFTPFNVIGSGDLTLPKLLWVDDGAAHSRVIWSSSGNQVLFKTVRGPEDFGRWNVLDVEDQRVTQLSPAIEGIQPLPDGFLARSSSGTVGYHSTDNPAASVPLWTPEEQNLGYIIWSSPAGTSFDTTNERDVPQVVCEGTPPSQMTVGQRGRVTFTDGTATRLRTAPDGQILRLMSEGTTFTVVGGPHCQAGYTWWFIELENGTRGWVGEGTMNAYFIEPLP